MGGAVGMSPNALQVFALSFRGFNSEKVAGQVPGLCRDQDRQTDRFDPRRIAKSDQSEQW
jgi:hypothetical protein